MTMVGWTIRDEQGWTVDTVYYQKGCDEQYIRAAEDIPARYSMKVD